MNENLDLTKVLKDCPKGTKLYSTIYGEVYFKGIDLGDYPISFTRSDDCSGYVTSKGVYRMEFNGECTLFPSKDQRDWSKWHGYFKDGDIIFTYVKGVLYDSKWLSIFRRTIDNRCETYVDMNISDRDFYINEDESKYFCNLSEIKYQRLATEEEKKLLFDVLKKNGYKWNAETKTLEKLVVSHTPEKFYIRIGDIPSNEKSKIYRGESVIGEEEGVSVYNCIKLNNTYHIVMPIPLKEGQGMTYECLIQEITQCRYEIENPRNVYLVSGIEVGKGHDNEPLIKDVKILKDLTEQFNTKNDNTKETKTSKKLVEPKFKGGFKKYDHEKKER